MLILTLMTINRLFAFSEQGSSAIKIPKAALPGIAPGQTITAGQFFASVLLRGVDYFPDSLLFREDFQISVKQSGSFYADLLTNQIISVIRTEIELSTDNLEDLT